jgi:hypothetical protein
MSQRKKKSSLSMPSCGKAMLLPENMFAGTLMFLFLKVQTYNAPLDPSLLNFDKFAGTNKFLPSICTGTYGLKKHSVHAHSYDRINALNSNNISIFGVLHDVR